MIQGPRSPHPCGPADIRAVDLDAVLHGLPPCTPRVEAYIASLPLREPFRISDHVFRSVDTLVVHLETDGCHGEGEAAGVYYLGDEPPAMKARLLAGGWMAGGLAGLEKALPAGGARNALDCAFWDLEAQRTGQPVWRLLGMTPPRPLLTTFTIGAATPEKMAADALAHRQARALKLKLDGSPVDAERIRAVRAARPDVWLGVDANRALAPATLDRLLPVLDQAGVSLIEQPFPVGRDAVLGDMDLPMPVAADESAQGLADLEPLAGLYDMVNIKLDKCGGLTEGLRMVRRARELGMSVMVGNMLGSSLAMAPAWLLGQFCEIVDLDGPTFLSADRNPGVTYRDGHVECAGVWGGF